MQVEAVKPHKNGKNPAPPAADENGVIPDIEQVLYLADKMIAAGEDPWEFLAQAAEREEDDADQHRFNQCDIAAKVVKRYREDSIADFARDAKIPVRRARDYRTVGLAYERTARDEFRASHPSITYTHLRVAARLKSEESAYRLLERAALRTWSSDKTEYVLGRMKRIYGDGKITPARKILDIECTVGRVDWELRRALNPATLVHVIVYEVTV